MTAAPRPLHTRLPRLSPQEARARNAWLAALDGRRIDGARLTARVATSDGSAGPALTFAAGQARLHLRGETIDGRPARDLAEGPGLPEALVELSRLEPLIALVERACGRPLDPIGVTHPPAGLTLDLTIDGEDGTLRHRARLIAPFDLALPAGRVEAQGSTLARLRTPCRLRLRGPSAPRGELAELETGDLVLLPRVGGLLDAALEVGNAVWRGGFSPTGAFHIREEENRMLDEPPSPDEAAPGAPPQGPAPDTAPSSALQRLAALPVRLQVVLPDLHVSVGDLAGLAPGSVTALPLKGEDLPVRLLADEVEIASGRLVALGDAYGVLIDAVAGRAASRDDVDAPG